MKEVKRELSEVESGLLNFINASNETVGPSVSDQPDTVCADCANLSSISIVIYKLQDIIGKNSALLVFDSLTSPYLLSSQELVRFMRLTLSKFAGEKNSILTCFDEGSGKEENLVAMMSLSNGVIKIEIRKESAECCKASRGSLQELRFPRTKFGRERYMIPNFGIKIC